MAQDLLPSPLSAWLIIAIIAGVTLSSRLVGPFLMGKGRPSPALERFLDGLSVSVIAAVVASALAQAGLREAFAVLLAVGIMKTTGSSIWAMVGGIALAALWSAGWISF